ncbi:hypothetical protein L1N85_15700 [Paenibacillus alkaliterrae]|uniref:hypothetical protein n=1 Tax=Paenibacillus alkaliterrae TaxID=320909 RepID=UPI001F2F8E6E|nr:hypothetical protein [Paenibacillus alkaliterrae]MCF2939862.1 hypothetical protein [Paenibacillus alkaliterrae]
MRKPFIKLTAACVLTALVIYSGGLQQQAATAAANAAEKPTAAYQPVEQQAKLFVDELAEQPDFNSWKQASLHVSPIGPGTHSWLVLVKQTNETVGYLVIHAVEKGGYQLGEYGISSHPLFDEQTLTRSVRQLELLKPASDIEPLYVHPLLAAWKVTAEQDTYYTDAASGELLPVQTNDWAAASSSKLMEAGRKQAPASAKLLKHVSLPSFNPYGLMPWLTKTPIQLSTSSYWGLFAKLNNKEQLRYTAELFEGQMMYVWSVVGYNKWNSGHLYIALEAGEDGTDRRYVPLLLLLELGHFYR